MSYFENLQRNISNLSVEEKDEVNTAIILSFNSRIDELKSRIFNCKEGLSMFSNDEEFCNEMKKDIKRYEREISLISKIM